MATLGLETKLVDKDAYRRTVARFREAGIALPTFAQLRDPETIPAAVRARLVDVGPDEPHPLNLFRVHWYNDADRRGTVAVPGYLELPPELTGVRARILVALGERFPMITAHKVLAAYGCLAPRLVTGQFDPTTHKALWPSTGNYCRGGVAISRIMGCRGVAILPAGMSRERFDWLDRWVADPEDVVRTRGTESNVKEIYDKCAELDAAPENIIFNQFSEFSNYLVHATVTGPALGRIFEDAAEHHPGLRLRAFTSATGSAGTIAAGDHLKSVYGAKIVAVEALECPTLLENGYGEHNIQGIGDKHIPFVHNAMNMDGLCDISESATDTLGLLFNSDVGQSYLRNRRGVDPHIVEQLGSLGFSSICNVLAAIRTARHYGYGEGDAIVTVATDGFAMYRSEIPKITEKYFNGSFDAVHAGEVFGQHVLGNHAARFEELDMAAKRRIFNLGYFTWVEQQGVSFEDFIARKEEGFWRELRALVPAWDALIDDFNRETGALAGLES